MDSRMEEAFDAAVAQIGGLEAAKPRAVFDLLQDAFPDLTLQNTKWHLIACRRRQERHKEAGLPEHQPLKWAGRLEEAYNEALAQLGGLQSARPKLLLQALQPDFPELTLQQCKWHLQKQRTREQRQQAATTSSAANANQPPQPSQVVTSPAKDVAQPICGTVSCSGGTRSGMDGAGAAAKAEQRMSQACPPPQVGKEEEQDEVEEEGEGKAEQRGKEEEHVPPAGLQQPMQHDGQVQHRQQQQQPQQQPQQQQQQQPQQQQQLQQQRQEGFFLLRDAPWRHHLLPEAQARLVCSRYRVQLLRQTIAELQQQVTLLTTLAEPGAEPSTDGSWGQEAAAALSSGGAGSGVWGLSPGPAPMHMSAPLRLTSLTSSTAQEGLLRLLSGHGTYGGAPVTFASHAPPSWRHSSQQAAVAASFPVLHEGKEAAAAAALAAQLQHGGVAEHLASCTVPGCRRCAHEVRLRRAQGEQGQHRSRQGPAQVR